MHVLVNMTELVWEGLVTGVSVAVSGRGAEFTTSYSSLAADSRKSVRSSVSSQSKISYPKTCESSIETSRFVAKMTNPLL